jgi:hypothetical protein
MKNKEVGASQLSTERGQVNERVDKLSMLGKSKTAEWRRKRRNRSI